VETERVPKDVKSVLKNERTNETISIPLIRSLDSLHEITGYLFFFIFYYLIIRFRL